MTQLLCWIALDCKIVADRFIHMSSMEANKMLQDFLILFVLSSRNHIDVFATALSGGSGKMLHQ